MDTYDEGLGKNKDAWVEAELAASPEWGPERYASIRQHLEGSAPAATADEQGHEAADRGPQGGAVSVDRPAHVHGTTPADKKIDRAGLSQCGGRLLARIKRWADTDQSTVRQQSGSSRDRSWRRRERHGLAGPFERPAAGKQ